MQKQKTKQQQNSHGLALLVGDSAFTLVELIVVITILAILGTISFISYQGFSIEARNSKTITNIGSINQSIASSLVNGIPIKSFLSTSSNELVSPYIAGDTTTGDNYGAGKINYGIIGAGSSLFLDTDNEQFKIGITTKLGSKFEVASIIEETNGDKIAIVKGTYSPRFANITSSAISHGQGTNQIVLVQNNGLKKGDVILIDSAPPVTREIKKLSGNTLILNTTIPNDANNVELNADEVLGLIADKDDDTKIIVNGGSYLPY